MLRQKLNKLERLMEREEIVNCFMAKEVRLHIFLVEHNIVKMCNATIQRLIKLLNQARSLK